MEDLGLQNLELKLDNFENDYLFTKAELQEIQQLKNELKEEVWKNIKDYEGFYMVSNLGRIKSLSKTIIRNNVKTNLKEIVMNPIICYYGYCKINFSKESKRKIIPVHRIVAEHFILNPENKPQVNHINGIKKDNRVVNLEWVTPSENMQHASKNNLMRFCYKKVLDLDTMIIYKSSVAAALHFGINRSNMSSIITGRRNSKLNLKYI